MRSVMPALVAGIHVLLPYRRDKDVDGRVKPGHDVERLQDVTSIYFTFDPVVFAARSTNELV